MGILGNVIQGSKREIKIHQNFLPCLLVCSRVFATYLAVSGRFQRVLVLVSSSFVLHMCLCKGTTVELKLAGIALKRPNMLRTHLNYSNNRQLVSELLFFSIVLRLSPLSRKSPGDEIERHRFVKSHDFVVSLTISRPISSSHESDFSCFLEKPNSQKTRCMTFAYCRLQTADCRLHEAARL